MVNAIFQHTPVWVWVLLAGLTVLGLSQTHDREMSLTRVTALPLAMLALSLYGVFAAFGEAPAALLGWAAGFGSALVVGRRFVAPRGAAWSSTTGLLSVRGSKLPLVLILALFLLKYGVGIGIALHAGLATDPRFAGIVSVAYGLFSGLFMARAVSLRRLASQPALQAA